MSLPIAPLPAAESTAAAGPRSAGRAARPPEPSHDPSQAWADALAQATGSSTANPATRARTAARTAMASGDNSAGPAHPSAPATASPSGAAAETANASSEAVMAPSNGFGDQTGLLGEPPLQSRPQDPADAVATAAAPKQDQATAETRTAVPDRHETAQRSTGSETASTATTRPLQANSAARTGQPVVPPKVERRHHTQQADTRAPATRTDPPASLSAGLGTSVAIAAPLRPDPPPPAATRPQSDGTVEAALAAMPRTSTGSAPQPVTEQADSATEAATGSRAGRRAMNIPLATATAPAKGATAGEGAPGAPGIALARPAVSSAPAAQAADAPLARGPSDTARVDVAPPNEVQAAAGLQAGATALGPAPADVRMTATPSPVPAGAGTHPAMPAAAVISTPSGDPQNATAASASVTPSQVTTSTQVAAGHRPAASGTLNGAPAIAIRTEAAAPAGLPSLGSELVQQAAGRPAGTNDAGLANRIQAVQATAARTPVGAGAAISLAVPQPAGPGDGKSPTIGRSLFDSGSAPAAVTGASPVPLGALTAGVGGSPQSPGASSAAGLSLSPFAGQTPAVPATATALAASVVAMSRSGQSTAVLRLDPPGLGSLSIHIALTANATVNVVFVPSVPQTAQLIHSALPDLHHAMASAGLSLGETQVGGGAGGNPNGQARNQTGDGSRFAQTTMLSRATYGADPALAKDALRGARAVA